MSKFFRVCFFLLVCFVAGIVGVSKDICKRCMPLNECPLFKDMSTQEQIDMRSKFPCQDHQGDVPYGFASVAKGDYVCCPGANVWGIENPRKPQISVNYQKPDDRRPQYNGQINNLNGDQNNQRSEYNYGNQNQSGSDNPGNDSDFNTGQNNSQDYLEDYSNERGDSGADGYDQNRALHHKRPRPNFNGFQGYKPRKPKAPNQSNLHTQVNNPNLNNPNFNGNIPYLNGQNRNIPNFNGQIGNGPSFNGHYGNVPNYNRPNGIFPNFNSPNGNNYNSPNSNFPNGKTIVGNQGPFNGNGNSFGTNLGGQCTALSSFPPEPESGCCGRDLSVGDRIIGPAQDSNSLWNFWAPNNPQRLTRSSNLEVFNITLANRITGGRETELEQFPWTVLLKTTFDYGNRRASFNCGGSIISVRYVLTAAHCISEEGARVSDIEVNLAEYDKRTFPRDCVNVPSEGRRCVDNVVMMAEDVVAHPEFDDRRLQNDIALIRLRGIAPYSDFIRPICLPPINVDNPQYSDLRLAVAGWGRNGQYVSQVKQSTVVNLVPQRVCVASYPQLTTRHLCAAGHSGEDTCKGDSGGPLMMLYGGKYFVSGVVSGKRADSPCGTSVPSLYTNVFHYLDWIRSNIRN